MVNDGGRNAANLAMHALDGDELAGMAHLGVK